MVHSLTGCSRSDLKAPSYSRLSWWLLMCWIQSAAVQHAKLTHNTESLIWLHPSPAELKQKPSAPLPPPSGCFHRLWSGSWLLDETRWTFCPLATWTAVWRAAARLAGWLSGAMALGVIRGWGWGQHPWAAAKHLRPWLEPHPAGHWECGAETRQFFKIRVWDGL